MGLTCRYSRSGASPASWAPKNTAAIVSSAGRSTFGFDRSKPFGHSVRRTSRTMAIAFLSSLRETHPQSSHFTDPHSVSKFGPPPSANTGICFGSNLLDVAFTQPRPSCVGQKRSRSRLNLCIIWVLRYRAEGATRNQNHRRCDVSDNYDHDEGSSFVPVPKDLESPFQITGGPRDFYVRFDSVP